MSSRLGRSWKLRYAFIQDRLPGFEPVGISRYLPGISSRLYPFGLMKCSDCGSTVKYFPGSRV